MFAGLSGLAVAASRCARAVRSAPRRVIAATFGTDQVGEIGYVLDLLGALRGGMIVLADRNFGTAPMIAAVAGAGADLLFRIKAGRRLPVCRRVADGSWR
jgi:hypothetical protein